MGATPPSGDGIPSDQNRAGRKFRFSGGREKKEKKEVTEQLNNEHVFKSVYSVFICVEINLTLNGGIGGEWRRG